MADRRARHDAGRRPCARPEAGRHSGARREAECASRALYLVATWVPRRTTIAVGSLGEVTFDRGWYAYVGSARRSRDARVARHRCADKPLRWHADYLFARFPGRLAWFVDGALIECELADALARLPDAARRPPRFGAGDCRCAGHLLHLARRPSTGALVAALPGALVRLCHGV